MAQLTMYPGKAGSPKTTTTADITDSDTQLFLTELSVLPAAPNLLILSASPTIWEVCPYTLKQSASGAGYVTIVRSGAEWASSTGLAQSWASGTKVARNFFLYDYSALKNNVEDHETRLGTVEDTDILVLGYRYLPRFRYPSTRWASNSVRKQLGYGPDSRSVNIWVI